MGVGLARLDLIMWVAILIYTSLRYTHLVTFGVLCLFSHCSLLYIAFVYYVFIAK